MTNGDDNIRRILSVQLAVIDPGDPDVVHEYVLLSLDGAVLPVERVVGYVIDRLGLPKTSAGWERPSVLTAATGSGTRAFGRCRCTTRTALSGTT